MNHIVKRNNGNMPMPFGGLVDKVFQNSLHRFLDDDFWGSDGRLSQKQVAVNLRETENTYEMELVAPGLRKEDFNINISGDMLTVSYEHKEEQENKKGGWLRKEYRMQSFTRSFNLDDTVNAEGIAARYEDGILHLTLPKKAEAQKVVKTIEIR
ncbi:MAG TPA: Hsp20/alpha crystallin family protein [Flavisolibacter sp.]|nr:Hsp20/alpha crystallin family protein [Flavisolibacter sp.]